MCGALGNFWHPPFHKFSHNIESRDKVGLKNLKELIQTIGGWHMIDSNWDAENYHWEDAYAKLKFVYDLADPLSFPIALGVTEDWTNASRNLLMVKFIKYKVY